MEAGVHLLLDESKVKRNIEMMVAKAAKCNTGFRPHFKTHQSAEVGNWFRDQGVDRITVSSVKMAHYFAKAGWMDILVAIPINFHEIDSYNALPCSRIGVTVESVEALNLLSNKACRGYDVYIKVDTGYGRCGVWAEDFHTIDRIVAAIGGNGFLSFAGFIAHFGHTYHANTKEDVKRIYNQGTSLLNVLKNQYPKFTVSIGDTPSCTLVEDLSLVDEIRPGNFVFYDAMQYSAGVCDFDNIGVCLAAPVVAKNEARSEIVIHCGAVHMSKEFVTLEGRRTYGIPVLLRNGTWQEPLDGGYVKSVSQEHGVIQVEGKEYKTIERGDYIGIIPVHSCLTADAMPCYYTCGGRIIDKFNL